MKNNGLESKYLEYVKFPGILLIGLFLFLYSIMRFNHWNLLNIMFSSGLGLVLVILGSNFYLKSDFLKIRLAGFNFSIILVIGVILSIAALIIFYRIDKVVTEVVAVLYSIGTTLLFVNITMSALKKQKIKSEQGAFPPPVQTPELPAADDFAAKYTNSLVNILQNAQQVLKGYENDVRKEKGSLETEVDELQIKLLELKDSLESYREKKEEGIINASYGELIEFLEDTGIYEMDVREGEALDRFKHVEINSHERPRDFKGVPKITKVKRPGYIKEIGNNQNILRKAQVEVDWAIK